MVVTDVKKPTVQQTGRPYHQLFVMGSVDHCREAFFEDLWTFDTYLHHFDQFCESFDHFDPFQNYIDRYLHHSDGHSRPPPQTHPIAYPHASSTRLVVDGPHPTPPATLPCCSHIETCPFETNYRSLLETQRIDGVWGVKRS